MLTEEQRNNPAIRARYRLLATVLVVEAVQDTLSAKHCAEAWKFFRSQRGAMCFGLGYLDEGYALQGLPKPSAYKMPKPKKRTGPKGKRVSASDGKRRKQFASFVEASAFTGDCVSTVGWSVRTGKKSQRGWTYRREA